MSTTFTDTAVLDFEDYEGEMVELEVEVSIDYYERYSAATQWAPASGGEMQLSVFDEYGRNITSLVTADGMERLQERAWDWLQA
jgi:hypothetical protein